MRLNVWVFQILLFLFDHAYQFFSGTLNHLHYIILQLRGLCVLIEHTKGKEALLLTINYHSVIIIIAIIIGKVKRPQEVGMGQRAIINKRVKLLKKLLFFKIWDVHTSKLHVLIKCLVTKSASI